jgi:hypothetical protein
VSQCLSVCLSVCDGGFAQEQEAGELGGGGQALAGRHLTGDACVWEGAGEERRGALVVMCAMSEEVLSSSCSL